MVTYWRYKTVLEAIAGGCDNPAEIAGMALAGKHGPRRKTYSCHQCRKEFLQSRYWTGKMFCSNECKRSHIFENGPKQRYQEAIELHRQGITYVEVGQRLGVSAAVARKRCKKAVYHGQ